MYTITQPTAIVASSPLCTPQCYAIDSPYWTLKESGHDWRKEVLHTRFKDAEELLIQKIREIRGSERALTREERETLITAFENFLHIHTLLLQEQAE